MNLAEIKKKLALHDKAWKAYRKDYPKRNWTDEAVQKKYNFPNLTNEERSFFEVEQFKKKKYSRYSAYLDNQDINSVTTWMGDPIGSVVAKKETKRRGFMGDPVFSITAKGINNMLYKGYGSRGALINLKAKMRKKMGVKL
jgi:hypothetical protein